MRFHANGNEKQNLKNLEIEILKAKWFGNMMDKMLLIKFVTYANATVSDLNQRTDG